MFRSLVSLSFVSLLAVGCATPYQGRNLIGGYTSVPLAPDTERVTFEGTASTRPENVEMFLHYRCAELTLQAGHRYFAVLKSDRADVSTQVTLPVDFTGTATQDVVTSLGPVVTTRYQTTYPPTTTYALVQPKRSAVIRMSSGERPSDAFDAAEVIALLRPHVRQASR